MLLISVDAGPYHLCLLRGNFFDSFNSYWIKIQKKYPYKTCGYVSLFYPKQQAFILFTEFLNHFLMKKYISSNYKTISITRNGVRYNAEIVRSAILHNGKDVYLFHILDFNSPISDKFVVAVTDGSKTFEWRHSHKIELAISLYLHILCCYA